MRRCVFLSIQIVPLVLVLGVITTSTTFAQDGNVAAPPKRAVMNDDSLTLFKSLFHYRKIKPLDLDDQIDSESMVVIVGNPRTLTDRSVRRVRDAIQNGGSVLIACRTELRLDRYFPTAPRGFGISDVDLAGPVDGARCFNRDSDAPFATLPRVQGPASTWFGSLERVACPFPAALKLSALPEEINETVAVFPQGTVTRVLRRFGPQFGDAPLAIVGIGPERIPYRSAVISCEALFENRWLLTTGLPEEFRSDNFLFAYQTVQWLQDQGKRTKCLFIEQGQVQSNFDYIDWAEVQSMPDPSIPPVLPSINPLDRGLQQKVAELVDGFISRAEDQHIPDNAITGGPQNDRQFITVLRVVATLLGVVLTILIVSRVRKSRHKAEYQPISKDQLLLGDDVRLGSFEHRRLEWVRGKNLLVPVKSFLRTLFYEQGLPESVVGGPMPRIEIEGRDRRELRSMIEDLWGIAFQDKIRMLPYSHWKELEPMIAMVQAAATANRWRVVVGGKQ